jgi:hypothetical protein
MGYRGGWNRFSARPPDRELEEWFVADRAIVGHFFPDCHLNLT